MEVQVVSVPSWSKTSWLVHGFSTRPGGKTTVYRQPGDLNLSFTDSDDRKNVAANRELFLQAAAGRKKFLGMVTLRQIHSSLIHLVGAGDVRANDQPAVLKGDGLMTGEPGVLLGIQTADCIPVLVADRKNRAVAAFHAGWRGTLARIVENGVGRMRVEFGSRPEDLIASVGPGIGRCCYSVGQEVRDQFESQFIYAADLFHEVYDSDPVREKYPMLFLTARAPGHSDNPPFWWIIRGVHNLQVEVGGVKLPTNARLHLYKRENYTAQRLEEFDLCSSRSAELPEEMS